MTPKQNWAHYHETSHCSILYFSNSATLKCTLSLDICIDIEDILAHCVYSYQEEEEGRGVSPLWLADVGIVVVVQSQ